MTLEELGAALAVAETGLELREPDHAVQQRALTDARAPDEQILVLAILPHVVMSLEWELSGYGKYFKRINRFPCCDKT